MRRRVVRSVATLMLVLVFALATQLATNVKSNGWQWGRSVGGQTEMVAYNTTLSGQPGGRVMCPTGWEWRMLSTEGSQLASPASTAPPFQSGCGADQFTTTGWEWKA